MYSPDGAPVCPEAGYPIRLSKDRRMCAPPPGFSQLTTAFLALGLLGIPRRPFLACPYRDWETLGVDVHIVTVGAAFTVTVTLPIVFSQLATLTALTVYV